MSDGEGSFVTRGCATSGVETIRDAQGNVVKLHEVPLCGQACQAVDWPALRRSIDAFVEAWTSQPVRVTFESSAVQQPDEVDYDDLVRQCLQLKEENSRQYHQMQRVAHRRDFYRVMCGRLERGIRKVANEGSAGCQEMVDGLLVELHADIDAELKKSPDAEETFTQSAEQMGKTAAAAIRDLENELETEKAERSRANAQIQRMSARLRQFDEQMAVAQKSSARQQRCIQWLAKRNITKRQEVNSLRDELAKAHERITDLSAELGKVKAVLSEEQTLLGRADGAIRRLNEELADAKASNWEQQCYDLKVELGTQGHELDGLKVELKRLKGDLGEANELADHRGTIIDRIRDKYTRVRNAAIDVADVWQRQSNTAAGDLREPLAVLVTVLGDTQ